MSIKSITKNLVEQNVLFMAVDKEKLLKLSINFPFFFPNFHRKNNVKEYELIVVFFYLVKD